MAAKEKKNYRQYKNSIPDKNRYKLKNKLDFENRGVDEHLVEIAKSMIKWNEDLAIPLGLSEAEVHTIISDNQNHTTLQQ